MVPEMTTDGENGIARDDEPRDDETSDDDLDAAIALLAICGDLGEPTVAIDLSTLTVTEKQAFLRLLRRDIGLNRHDSDKMSHG